MTNVPDPTGNVFAAAIEWISGTLLGTLASTIAVLAVASVGFLLLSGRVDVRRATQVILGCFVLFGASTMASGIVSLLTGSGSKPEMAAAPPPPAYAAAPVNSGSSGTPSAYDPYAGAALPTRP